jgi:hypothetical protein
LITFFFLGLALGLSLPATAFLHSSRLKIIKDLYQKYAIDFVQANRFIS